MPDVRGNLAGDWRLKPIILLLLRDGESHGYELIRLAGELDLEDCLSTGSVYQILRRLTVEGLVTSWWDMRERGPARRVFVLTAQGESHLTKSLPQLAELEVAVRKLRR